MSAAEQLVPLTWTPNPNESEVEKARLEDPDFLTVQARCRAKARGETYKPEVHGPFAAKLPPRQEREKMEKPVIDVEALLARFRSKARADEPGVRRVHDR